MSRCTPNSAFFVRVAKTSISGLATREQGEINQRGSGDSDGEIEVGRYPDRLEVLSPSALQNSMTVKKMIGGQRSQRNPLIAEVLSHYGYVDARGMGVCHKIIPLLMEHNGTEPEFIATEDYLRLVLRNGRVQSNT